MNAKKSKRYVIFRRFDKMNDWECGHEHSSLEEAKSECDRLSDGEPGVIYRVFRVGIRKRSIGQPLHYARTDLR